MRHHIAIFCQVVDNYGDIGFCWRLARQLVLDYAQQVTLWVDDFASFQKICGSLDLAQAVQAVEGVSIRHW
ncbi:MAG: elongation factor maturation arginine rhamnosyltransferase EarP, partial [Pseudomonadota bacterium]